ncbi:APC family permease [Acidianus sulfidivorans JP7]|uniref:APC family permease n=1 Tax=Acidianus sulfidivorans JP7 TaxID=619593 RepID=A0A2U9IKM9_9CREN|nr:APC family permease [Acidianus sulfidivorans]AWR96592.1 APC family permease [Acidianus sulfidivorans JP7]
MQWSKKLEPKEGTLPKYLIVAQSLSSIAPLGSVSAYLTFALQDSLAGTFIAAILGALIYLFWVLIGYNYSKIIATTGGIYDFAKFSAGNMVGKIAGWLYWISYAIYLPSVTTYLVGIVLPTVFNVQYYIFAILEVLIPIILTLLLISGIKPPLFYALITSSIEIILIISLGTKILLTTGIHYPQFDITQSQLWSGALAVAFTLAGGGASFFLGYEAKGRGRTVGTSYLLAFSIASIAVIFASYFEIAAVGYTNSGISNLLSVTLYPGYYLSKEYLGSSFSIVFFIFTINSLLGSAIAAYVALSRLTYSLVNKTMFKSILIVAIFFIFFNSIAAITGNYSELYNLTTEASITTLFSSHLIISAVYPLFIRKTSIGNIGISLVLAIVSTVLMGYGIFSNVIPYSYPASFIGILSIIAGIIIALVQFTLTSKLN